MCAIVFSCCSDCQSSYVDMMTFLNWVPPQDWKALAAMEVVVVVMVTFAQPQQAEQLQYTPSIIKEILSWS